MTDAAPDHLAELYRLIETESGQTVRPAIKAITAAARDQFDGVCAVLFYGSCLRDGDDTGRIADLYILVDAYRTAYGRVLPAFFNRLLPPNVGYLEAQCDGATVRAKYAVMTLNDFGRAATWFHPYIWARFSQPCRVAYRRDDDTADQIIGALAASVLQLADKAGPLSADETASKSSGSSNAFWSHAFAATYAAELRAERPGRGDEIYRADKAYYDAIYHALALAGAVPQSSSAGVNWMWRLRRWQGKILSVARLAKAAFTFDDGATYILWKIERHSGVAIEITPWQRRHPILASTTLFWRLYAKGAFK